MKLMSRTIGLAVLLSLPIRLMAQSYVVAAPLPTLDFVIQHVVAESSREADLDRAFKQRYSYTRLRVTEYRNTDGDLKSREQKTDIHQPQHIATSPNHGQTDESKPAAQSSGASIQGDSVRGKAFDRNDFLLNPDLLNRFQFTLVRREIINGRPALMINFQPKSGVLPEQSIKDRFINRAAGCIWVDEQDYALVKADVHLTQRVNVFGGLVGAVWKCTYSFERARTDDGLWFVRNVDWHLEGRAVIVRRIVDYHEQWTNVRKTG
jgi:hypothetical protein